MTVLVYYIEILLQRHIVDIPSVMLELKQYINILLFLDELIKKQKQLEYKCSTEIVHEQTLSRIELSIVENRAEVANITLGLLTMQFSIINVCKCVPMRYLLTGTHAVVNIGG